MSSNTEAELGALFIKIKQDIPMRTTLEELGHKQPPTPIQTDNSTASGVVNNKIQPKATKVMDMCYYWLKTGKHKNNFRFTDVLVKLTGPTIGPNTIQAHIMHDSRTNFYSNAGRPCSTGMTC